MKDDVVAEVIAMRQSALRLGAVEVADAIERALSLARVRIQAVDGGTIWRRLTIEEDAQPADPKATIRGNIMTDGHQGVWGANDAAVDQVRQWIRAMDVARQVGIPARATPEVLEALATLPKGQLPYGLISDVGR